MDSKSYFEKAVQLMPGGVNSPVRAFRHVGMTPVYFERAQGAHLYDVEGNSYIDFCMAFGPHLLGHCPESVVDAIRTQSRLGMAYGACHPAEVEMAKKLLEGYPFLDQARLLNSGTEAVMTAIRIARGFTNRNKVLVFDGCYHGHSDGLLARAGSGVADLSESSSRGVPASVVSETIVCALNEKEFLEKLHRHGSEIAAVCMELVPANNGLVIPSKELIHKIVSETRKVGALFIADEVITGFRLGLNGASGYFDVKPDLVTMGKIIGGGLPLAAVLGRAELISQLAPVGPVYQAGTFSGNPLSIAAGLAALNEVTSNPPYAVLEKRTQRLVEGVRQGFRRQGVDAKVHTLASIFWIEFAEGKSRYQEFFKMALEHGIYLPPSPYEVCFLSLAHSEEVVDQALRALCG